MRKLLTIATLTLLSFSSFAQVKMREEDELINKTEPGWPIVRQLVESAKNKVEVLSTDSTKAKETLYKIQVTTRSPIGAVVYMTGGILVDNGWIRILGSGNTKLTRTLPDWNKGKTLAEFGTQTPYLLIADDAIGGFFLLNGGGLGTDVGKVYYFSPESLDYEPLDLTYTDFLTFCFNGNLDKFYDGLRWKNWKKDVSTLSGDSVYSFYPNLWSKEGKDITKDTREVVQIDQLYLSNMDFRKQLGIEK